MDGTAAVMRALEREEQLLNVGLIIWVAGYTAL